MMKAVVARGAGDFVFQEVEDPPLPSDGYLLEVEAAGVCAADRMIWEGNSPWNITFPFTPGHEIVGRIADIGANAKGSLDIGDRVAVEVMAPCGICHLCRDNRENLCRDGAHFGSQMPGAFAEMMALPGNSLIHRVPENISLQDAAGIEMLANAVHILKRAALNNAGTVVVTGVGAIGATVIQLIKHEHPGAHIVAVVRDETKVERALSLGAHTVLSTSPHGPSSVVEAFFEKISPNGARRIIELSGSVEAVDLALELVAPGGRICLYGVYNQRYSIDLNQIAEFKELELVGGHLAPNGAFAQAIALLADGKISLSNIIQEPLPLDKFESALTAHTGHKYALSAKGPHS
ncbi:MAG: alcohol dehydrogenase catalytic domain-containing protein [Pontimonas sp.]|nr:alcohol dehydrogenase catalytic domain-containing protein [Pontimonas sp.]